MIATEWRLSRTDLASRMGLSEKTISRYLEGERVPGADNLAPLEALGVDLTWLCTGVGSMRRPAPSTAPIEDRFVLVPRYDVRVAAGAGAVVHSDQVVDHLAFKREWVRDRLRVRPEDLALVQVVGDSMQPTLGDGDLALVHLAERRLAEGAAYVIETAGELRVKRISRRMDGTVVVGSDNPRYAAEELAPDVAEHLRVLGRVIWHAGPL
jgi:phage repressor protein C with HTH and peptisase S24 domain